MAQQLRMPRLSLAMTEGRIVEWLKKEGDPVEKGEAVANIESDKSVVALEAPASGVLRKVLVPAGADAVVDTPLAILAARDEDIQGLLSESAGKREAEHARESAPGTAAGPASLAPGRRPMVSPVARRLAQQLGVDLSGVAGTGPGGLVTEKDVRTFAESSAATPPEVETDDDTTVIPLTGVRRRIAERLSLSRLSAADVTTVADVDMTEVARVRKEKGASYTAYVVWAVGQALRDYPTMNSWFVDDRIHQKKRIHIGVAAALDQGQGLVVPVVRSADGKGVEDVSREIDDLAAKAKTGQLGPEELTGSTFTVTNSGGFGSLFFTPIINQPEIAILGMGKVADTPVVRDGEIVVRKVMYLALSYDHRVVDGSTAVQFLQAVRRRLEQPE